MDPVQDRTTDLLRHRNFRNFLMALVVSALGSTMTSFALAIIVMDITRSAAMLTWVSAVGTLPFLFIGLPAGAIINVFDRRNIMRFCDLLQLINAAVLGLCAWYGQLSFPLILVASFVAGMFQVFHTVAESSLLPQLVAPSQLNRANGLMFAVLNACWFIGPVLAGFVYERDQAWMLFAFDGFSFLASYLILSRVRGYLGVERPLPNFKVPLGAEIKKGLLEIWQHPLVFHSMVVVVLGNLFGQNLSNYIFAYNKEILGVDAHTLGIGMAILASGAVLGSHLSADVSKWMKFVTLILVLKVLDFVARIFIPYSGHWFWVVTLAAVVTFMQGISNVAVIAHRQSSVRLETLGVVNSAFKSMVFISRPLSQLLAGGLITAFGLQTAFRLNGFLFLIPVFYAGFFWLKMRNNNSNRSPGGM